MMPEYDLLDDVLMRMGSGAAEAHGSLCGMLCADPAFDRGVWMGEILEQAEAGEIDQARTLLEGVYEQSTRELNDSALSFFPLLPDDEVPLEERVEALGRWCQGFLYGISIGGVSDQSALPEDSDEILRDFADIARGGFDVEDGAADEDAYAEITEYVRMGVLLINEELQPVRKPPLLH